MMASPESIMKLNELVCPTCGLKCLTDAAWTTCASCNTLFYANQSRSVDSPLPLAPKIVINPGVTGPLISPQPSETPIDITPTPIWIVPYGPPGTPYGPSGSCVASTGGMSIVDQDQYQVWN